MLPRRTSLQPGVGRSIPSDLLRAMPGHWQLRELAGAYVYANGRCLMDQLRQSNGLIVTRMRNVLFVLLAPTMLAVAAGVEPPSAGKPAVDKGYREPSVQRRREHRCNPLGG